MRYFFGVLNIYKIFGLSSINIVVTIFHPTMLNVFRDSKSLHNDARSMRRQADRAANAAHRLLTHLPENFTVSRTIRLR